MSMYKPVVRSFFSGMGGLDLGLSQAGCEIIESLEIDEFACQTLRANFSHKISQTDISKETVLDKADCDVMAFTYPCTKYSAIADIHQARTGDHLFLESVRHVALYSPEAYIVENVPGMKRFKVVMEVMTKLPNYYVQVFCPLNASNWVPQDRKRLFIIATKKPFYIAEPAPSVFRPTIKSILEKDVQIDMPQYVLDRINGKYRDKPIVVDPENKYALAPTAVAHYAKDRSTRLVKDKNHPYSLRPFTVREYSRLQGFPDDFVFPVGDYQAYKQIGNAVAVPMGRWVGSELVKYFNKNSSKLKPAA